MSTKKQRAGYLAIVGATNAGKSTLLNTLLKTKLASVSHKIQTTNMCITGVWMHDKAQIVLIDTPGLFSIDAKNKNQTYMMRHILYSIDQANAILFLVDAQNLPQLNAIKYLQSVGIKKDIFLALNKVDAIKDKSILLEKIKLYNTLHPFSRTFLISGLKDKGLDVMMKEISLLMPEHDWFYSDDHLTTLAGKELAVEALRGAIFKRFNKEIPYQLELKVCGWNRDDKQKLIIDMTIKATTISHKKILLGHKGSGIGYLREATQNRLEHILGEPVRVVLHIQVE